MQKRCAACGLLKPVATFGWHRKHRGQRDSYCRPCRAAYKKSHYAANRQRYIDNAGRRKRELSEENVRRLFDFFIDHPCIDCGETDPLVLEFDHIGPKAFSVARAMRERRWEAIEQEMSQCEVVCANCHRRRTAQRGGFMRATIGLSRSK